MIYIELTEDKTVGFTHYQPFDENMGLGKTAAELEEKGFLIDSIPQPASLDGKMPIMKYDSSTKTIFYEYVDVPKTKDELQADEIAQLKAKLESTQDAVDFLLTLSM